MGLEDYEGPVQIEALADGAYLITRADWPAPPAEPDADAPRDPEELEERTAADDDEGEQ